MTNGSVNHAGVMNFLQGGKKKSFGASRDFPWCFHIFIVPLELPARFTRPSGSGTPKSPSADHDFMTAVDFFKSRKGASPRLQQAAGVCGIFSQKRTNRAVREVKRNDGFPFIAPSMTVVYFTEKLSGKWHERKKTTKKKKREVCACQLADPIEPLTSNSSETLFSFFQIDIFK